jgi:putative peptidoglycan lipid II flippase
MNDREHREREHFFGAAKMVAGITVLSRILGMLRDIAIASLGAKRITDAFVFAFRIPNLFRRLFGEGALAGAFVPVFTETGRKEGQSSAAALLANAMGLLAVFLAVLTVVIQVGIVLYGWGQNLWSGELSADGLNRQLLLVMTLIMLPFMISTCLLALASSALNCRGHFSYPAFAPCVLNICVVVAAWWVAPHWQGDRAHLLIISLSVTAASILQLVGVLWIMKAHGLPIRPTLRPIHPGIRTMLRLMGPTVLALGFPQLSSFFEGWVIWFFTKTSDRPVMEFFGRAIQLPLHEGTQMHVYNASQLYQFPMGVLAISLGVAVFPLLSRYAARGEMHNLRDGLNRALRVALMEGIAAGVGLLVLAGPITEVIYCHGKFTAGDVGEVAGILRAYVVGMWAYCTYQILLKAFFSIKETIQPLKVVAVMAVVHMAMVVSLIWVPGLGAKAFGVATATTISLDVVVLAILLRKRLGRIGARKLIASTARSCAASAVMAATILLLRWAMPGRPAWQIVAACVPAGAAVFLLTAKALRSPELGEILGSLRRQPQVPDDSTSPSEI